MTPRIGFVIVTYNSPEQTTYLCRRLTELFGAPPIALHHDFGQCDLDRARLPSNVRLVEPWFRTGWGSFPVVEANLAALRLLYEMADPDWCVSLSTTDYPIKSAERILQDLKNTPFDAFLDHRQLFPRRLPAGYVRDESRSFNDPAWMRLAYHRYVATDLNPGRLTWRFPSLHRPWLLRGTLAERIFTPFSRSFRPYGGDAWYTVNRRAARIVTQQDELFSRLKRHYRRRRVPEESVYHTLLCNRPELRLSPNNLRYTDWSRGGHSPRTLHHDDIPVLMRSQAHFARKFPFDPNLFQEIDVAAEQRNLTSA